MCHCGLQKVSSNVRPVGQRSEAQHNSNQFFLTLLLLSKTTAQKLYHPRRRPL